MTFIKILHFLRLRFKKQLSKFLCIPSFCKVCGVEVRDFEVPQYLWESIVGDEGTVWCFHCFSDVCTKRGICTYFKLIPRD